MVRAPNPAHADRRIDWCDHRATFPTITRCSACLRRRRRDSRVKVRDAAVVFSFLVGAPGTFRRTRSHRYLCEKHGREAARRWRIPFPTEPQPDSPADQEARRDDDALDDA